MLSTRTGSAASTTTCRPGKTPGRSKKVNQSQERTIQGIILPPRQNTCQVQIYFQKIIQMDHHSNKDCFPSNLERSQDDYVPMHQSPTRGQEDIALLTLTSGDSFEGEKYHITHVKTNLSTHTDASS